MAQYISVQVILGKTGTFVLFPSFKSPLMVGKFWSPSVSLSLFLSFFSFKGHSHLRHTFFVIAAFFFFRKKKTALPQIWNSTFKFKPVLQQQLLSDGRYSWQWNNTVGNKEMSSLMETSPKDFFLLVLFLLFCLVWF